MQRVQVNSYISTSSSSSSDVTSAVVCARARVRELSDVMISDECNGLERVLTALKTSRCDRWSSHPSPSSIRWWYYCGIRCATLSTTTCSKGPRQWLDYCNTYLPAVIESSDEWAANGYVRLSVDNPVFRQTWCVIQDDRGRMEWNGKRRLS